MKKILQKDEKPFDELLNDFVEGNANENDNANANEN